MRAERNVSLVRWFPWCDSTVALNFMLMSRIHLLLGSFLIPKWLPIVCSSQGFTCCWVPSESEMDHLVLGSSESGADYLLLGSSESETLNSKP